MYHFSNDYYAFVPSTAVASTASLVVAVTAPPFSTTPAATALVINPDGSVFTRAPVVFSSSSSGSTGTATVPFGGKSGVVLVLTNPGTAMTGCGTDGFYPVFSCSGVPEDDRTFTFSAQVVP